MLSQILISKDKSKRREFIDKICAEYGIDKFDLTIIEKENSIKQNVNSIGIEDVKNIQKKIFLKPIKSPIKAVVIEDAQMLTVQAQNSLLKILEEPPDRTIIFLSADSSDVFISTIISRCKIIVLNKELQKYDENISGEAQKFLETMDNISTGDLLKYAENLAKDKDRAIEWTECVILGLREVLLKESESGQTGYELIDNIKKFQTLRSELKNTNINIRFAIENTLLLVNSNLTVR